MGFYLYTRYFKTKEDAENYADYLIANMPEAYKKAGYVKTHPLPSVKETKQEAIDRCGDEPYYVCVYDDFWYSLMNVTEEYTDETGRLCWKRTDIEEASVC